jgi:HK97 gp10 family phage protein
MASEIRVEGLEEVIERLDKIVDMQQLETAVGRACAIVERSAKQKAPKGDGDLRRSITSKVIPEGSGVLGVVYTPLEYAPYVEFGTGLFAENGGRTDVPWCYQDDKGEWHTTSGQHPQPYMRPALHENRERIKRTIKEGILSD